MKKITIIILLISCTAIYAQQPVHYLLEYYTGDNFLTVTIQVPPATETSSLVIPRSGPGTYSMTNYAAFVENVNVTDPDGTVHPLEKGMGSYFDIESEQITAVNYQVNLKRMEEILTDGSVTSKLRENYLGILGYSVFGFVDGLQDRSVELTVRTSSNWQIFSTLAPTDDRPMAQTSFVAPSFAELADAQYLLGNDVNVLKVEDAPIPLFVAAYAEVPVDMNEIGRRVLLSLNGLAEFYGYIPMPHYTAVFEVIIPPTPQHEYGFWMEHMNSMTGAVDTSGAITAYEENPRLGGIVHHIGHSWVPLRSYGTGYRPFEWQVAPLIETIWLNEGFTWYISFYYVLNNKNILNFFRNSMESAPDYIDNLSLRELSLLGSTQYAEDFRIGRNLFSRGALLAHDIDMEIQEKTNGEKSFRDVMLGLLQWTRENKRPFEYEEIEPIMSSAVDVDLSAIWAKWQLPPADR